MSEDSFVRCLGPEPHAATERAGPESSHRAGGGAGRVTIAITWCCLQSETKVKVTRAHTLNLEPRSASRRTPKLKTTKLYALTLDLTSIIHKPQPQSIPLGKVREFCFTAARSDGQRGFAVPPLDQLQTYRVRD